MSQSSASATPDFTFYTVQFFFRKSGVYYTHVVTGTRKVLTDMIEPLKNDESVDSVAVTYICTIAAGNTSPFIVKALKEEDKKLEVK